MNEDRVSFQSRIKDIKIKYFDKYKSNILSSKFFIPGVILAIAILIIIIGVKVFASSGGAQSSNSQNPQISTLKKTEINRNFDFPILDDKGKEVGKISYEILSAELDKNILVLGKFATAVSGKLFFVVNIKLTNSQNNGISINTKDYLRLSINGDFTELLAPSLHNDPVTVQPISIQNSRLGFIVNENDRGFILQVGEIKGTKQKIKINL